MSGHAHGAPTEPVRLWSSQSHEHDMMSTRLFGFWLYMLSDSLIFAALFAAYDVLSFPTSFAGGPTPRQVASPGFGYLETIVLFASVFAYGMVMVQLKANRRRMAIRWLTISLVVGLLFIAMEVFELYGVAHDGGLPERSGFLSAFWAVIVAHGMHLLFGLLWMGVMIGQVSRFGFTELVIYRLANLKIYWLYQGLIWTFVYTFVYLRGSI